MPKILVADDSIAVRKVAERLLTEAGLGVTLAANGEEALAYLSKERPDVVVSDVIMPDKSGYEVCAFVRGNASLASTPVLLISGIVNDEVTKQAESCHADGVLKKPFQGTSLKDRVLELLAKRQVQAAPQPTAPPPVRQAPVAESWTGPRISDEQLDTYKQAVIQVKELDVKLKAERAQVEQLSRRIGELEAAAGRTTELEGQVAKERQRVSELHDLSNKLAALEAELVQERHQGVELKAQVVRAEESIAAAKQFEAALKSEQETAQAYRQQVAALQPLEGKVAELEASLASEREAAAELVQQLTMAEQIAARAKELETRLTETEQRATGAQTQVRDTKILLETERTRGAELTAKLEAAEQRLTHLTELEAKLAQSVAALGAGEARIRELEASAGKIQELEALLATERDRNMLLARRVDEAEQAAEQSTKRFEDMARKLGEIAGLASQLGTGKTRP
ncbi:MAG: response regulator [Nitrospira sp.]